MPTLKTIIKRVQELAGKEFIDGYSLKTDLSTTKRYHNGCSPDKKEDNGIYISYYWYFELNPDDVYWNSLLCAIGHERTHFDIFNIEPDIKDKIKEYHAGCDENMNIRFANWLKEVFCDIYGAKRAGRTKADLIIRLEKYACTNKVDSDKYPSMENRTKFASYEEFDESLITEIANTVYGEDIISEEAVAAILELFRERTNVI